MKINADMMNLKEAPLFKNQTQIEGQRERRGKKGKIPHFFLWHPFESVEADWTGRTKEEVCVCVRERESTERDEHRNIVF